MKKPWKALKKIKMALYIMETAAIVITVLCVPLYLTFRTPFTSEDKTQPYGHIDAYRSRKKDVLIDENSRVKSRISTAPEIIGSNAFRGKNITSFTSTAFVKFIDPQAFSDCQNLRSIKLNQGLLEIRSRAFENCPVEEIEIPSTVYHLGADILSGSRVKKITVGRNLFLLNPWAFKPQLNTDDVEFIFTDDDAAFDPMTYVSFSGDDHKEIIDIFCPFDAIWIPEGVESLDLHLVRRPDSYISDRYIGYSTWYNRSNVKLIILPDSLKRIAKNSFSGADIKFIAIPDTMEELEESVFNNSELTSIQLGNNLKKIGNSCFSNSALKRIVIPDSIKEIEDYAFYSCHDLAYVSIGDGLEKIGSCTFKNCSSLSFVELGKSVRRISNDAFYGCKKLKHIEFNEGLEEIGDWAFEKTNLKSVLIPKSVKRIGFVAFPKNLETAYILNPNCIIDNSFSYSTKVIYINGMDDQ